LFVHASQLVPVDVHSFYRYASLRCEVRRTTGITRTRNTFTRAGPEAEKATGPSCFTGL